MEKNLIGTRRDLPSFRAAALPTWQFRVDSRKSRFFFLTLYNYFGGWGEGGSEGEVVSDGIDLESTNRKNI